MQKAVAIFFVLVSAAVASQAEVLCESIGTAYRECRVDSSGKIELVRELSDGICAEGSSWGTQSEGIVWVARGCRAVFRRMEMEPPRQGRKAVAKTVSCESKDEARVHCAAETKFGVALARQTSNATCVLEQSWGFDEKGVWVAGGCAGQFVLGGFRLPANAVPPTAKRLVCESPAGGGRALCETDASRGAGLIRQIGKADCVLNRTWGYDRQGIWVSGGCHAEFAVAQ